MPTVREIAERAGVSISTVSLALNNKKGIAEETRQSVLRVAAELAGQETATNGLRHTHANGRPRIVMVLHPANMDDDVFTAFLRGIWAATAGTNIQLQMTVNDLGAGEHSVSHLFFSDAELLPDGLVALGARKSEPVVEEALAAGVPCVLVQRETDDPTISAVGVDEVRMAREATDYLLSLGHERIGFAGGKPDYSYTDGRVQGYREALLAAGIDVPDRWVSLGWDRETTARLIEAAPEVTAIVFLDDGYALQYGIPALSDAGLRIPDDVSILSFDDIHEAREHAPPITSVQLPFYEMSLRAVRAIIDQVENPLVQSQHMRLRPVLHRRASCAPPAAA